jgi:hypothetical protein
VIVTMFCLQVASPRVPLSLFWEISGLDLALALAVTLFHYFCYLDTILLAVILASPTNSDPYLYLQELYVRLYPPPSIPLTSLPTSISHK